MIDASVIDQAPKTPQGVDTAPATSLLRTTFSHVSLNEANTLLGLCSPHHSVRFVNRRSENLPTRVQREKGPNGETVIAIPSGEVTVEELLRAAHLLDPESQRDNPNSPFRQLTRNLQDGAILLSHMVASSQDADTLVAYLYNMGAQLNHADEGGKGAFSPKTADEIRAMEITYPESFDTPEKQAAYNREIEYYLLFGKNVITPEGENAMPYNVAENTPYAFLYRKWRERQGANAMQGAQNLSDIARVGAAVPADSWKLRRQFEEEYLPKILDLFHQRPKYMVKILTESLQSGRAGDAIDFLSQAGAFQQLFGEAAVAIGERHVASRLVIPNDLEQQLALKYGGEFAQKFVEGFDLTGEAQNLFSRAEDVVKKLEKQPPALKIVALFELVRSFPSSDENGYVSDFVGAAERQEFNCTLKSYLLARLLQTHLGDKIRIFGVSSFSHVELITVFDDNGEKVIWGINPNTKYVTEESKTKDSTPSEASSSPEKPDDILPFGLPIGLELPNRPSHKEGFSAIVDIRDPNMQEAIGEAEKWYGASNPQFFTIPPSDEFSHSSMTIGPWDRLINAAIVGNLNTKLPRQEMRDTLNFVTVLTDPTHIKLMQIGHMYRNSSEKDTAKQYYEAMVQLYPESFEAWYFLANTESDPKKAVVDLQRSLSIDPTYEHAWSFLGGTHIDIPGDIDVARRCLRAAIVLNTQEVLHWYNLGASYAEKYNTPPSSDAEFQEALYAWTECAKRCSQDKQGIETRQIAEQEHARIDALYAAFKQAQQ